MTFTDADQRIIRDRFQTVDQVREEFSHNLLRPSFEDYFTTGFIVSGSRSGTSVILRPVRDSKLAG